MKEKLAALSAKKGRSIVGNLKAVKKQKKEATIAEEKRKTEEKRKIEEARAKAPKLEITTKTIQNLWESFAEQLDTESSKGLFRGIKPELKRKKISVIVSGITQQGIVAGQNHNFLNFLKRKLGETDLTIHIEVDKSKVEEQSNSKFYTPVDRFKKMVEDNPALKDMQERLNLDIQY